MKNNYKLTLHLLFFASLTLLIATSCKTLPFFAKIDSDVNKVNSNIISDVNQANSNNVSDVNQVYSNGITPLLSAVNKFNPTLVKTLLAEGAKVNATGSLSWTPVTPLMQACYNGPRSQMDYYGGPSHLIDKNKIIEVIDELIKAGAKVNYVNPSSGNTPLINACENNGGISRPPSVEVVKALIKAGAKVNAKNGNGDTPLLIACVNNHFGSNWFSPNLELLETLIKAGANINVVNKNNQTALMLTCHKPKNFAVVKALIKAGAETKVNATNNNGNTPLSIALNNPSNIKIVKALIKAGANVNAINGNGNPLLIQVLEAEPEINIKLAEVLIKAGANVNVRSWRKKLAINIMLDSDLVTPKLLELLIKAGLKVNHSLINTSKPKLLKVLINAGVNVNYIFPKGNSTPLILACEGNVNFESVEALIKAGANVNATNSYGDTPLSIACNNSSTLKTVKALIEAGADVNYFNSSTGSTPLINACNINPENPQIVEALIKAGAKVNAHKNQALTDVCSNFQNPSLTVVNALIEAGANVNTPNVNGYTPLMSACMNGGNNASQLPYIDKISFKAGANNTSQLPEIVKVLIKAGANVNFYSPQYNNVLFNAIKLNQSLGNAGKNFEYNIKIIKILINNGATLKNIDIKNIKSTLNRLSQSSPEMAKLLSKAEVDIKSLKK